MRKGILLTLLVVLYIVTFGYSPLFAVDANQLYQWNCAQCHGVKGDGKGLNAEFLSIEPLDHTDDQEMNERSPGRVTNDIVGGGKKVGKSTAMPNWGENFTKEEVSALVDHLKKLCNCKLEGKDEEAGEKKS
jgi:cytochrome c oxidase cbb3-type subunit 3